MARAGFNLKVAVFISGRRGNAKPFFKTAHELYLAEVGVGDARTAIAAFYLGKYALTKKNYKEAKLLLQASINTFEAESSQLNRQMELTARAFIIEALEELGESEVATQHCRVIGSKSPIVPNAEYLPVYKKAPVYPTAALRRGTDGWVIVEFSVDDSGFTRNHKVVKSTASVLESASIDAVKKFRYAPRFENGVAISTDGVQNRLVYELAR